MSAYQLTLGAAILRNSDGAFVPPDPRNRDYQAYLAWVAAGNTPDPVPVPPNPTILSLAAFFARFTAAEQSAIQAACGASPTLALGMTTAVMLGYVDLANPAVATWLTTLVAAGALTSVRAQAVLVP